MKGYPFPLILKASAQTADSQDHPSRGAALTAAVDYYNALVPHVHRLTESQWLRAAKAAGVVLETPRAAPGRKAQVGRLTASHLASELRNSLRELDAHQKAQGWESISPLWRLRDRLRRILAEIDPEAPEG